MKAAEASRRASLLAWELAFKSGKSRASNRHFLPGRTRGLEVGYQSGFALWAATMPHPSNYSFDVNIAQADA